MNSRQLIEVAETRRLVASGAPRSIREAAHLSLDEVAASVGVSASAVCRWELGQRLPRGDAALRYGRLLRRLMER